MAAKKQQNVDIEKLKSFAFGTNNILRTMDQCSMCMSEVFRHIFFLAKYEGRISFQYQLIEDEENENANEISLRIRDSWISGAQLPGLITRLMDILDEMKEALPFYYVHKDDIFQFSFKLCSQVSPDHPYFPLFEFVRTSIIKAFFLLPEKSSATAVDIPLFDANGVEMG